MLRLLLFSTLVLSVAGEYSPGSPGGEWTLEELLIVRAKIWSLLYDNSDWQTSAIAIYKSIPETELPIKGLPTAWRDQGLRFFPAKLLRLSFHDCVKYKDGSGGCDGCLNWKGMEMRFSTDQAKLKYSYTYPDIKEGTNNGLEFTVALLEKLYTERDFPPNSAPSLSESLKSSGKSRADLWAYAAKVAIEYSVERNNYHCDKKPPNNAWNGSFIGYSGDCHRYLEEPDCKFELTREIRFRYGRKDCIPKEGTEPFKAAKEEVHPNPEGNGDDTIDFFKSEFGFTAKQTVAIMGSHTIGKMNMATSLFKYSWTSRGSHMFNNAYYRNFVNKHDWFIESQDGNTCRKIGDADGKLPDVKWVPTMNGFTKSGGPMHWIKVHFTCPNCYNRMKDSWMSGVFDRCCTGKPKDKMCKPDHATRNDVDDIQGCETYRFAFGLDEMAINAEMGLYFKFDEVNGIPVNCKGLKDFNMETWKRKPNQSRQSVASQSVAWHHGCGLNMRREPKNAQPVSRFFDIYAKDQSKWVRDYVPTFEKMTKNGYKWSDLKRAPDSWDNVRCLEVGRKKRFECSKN